MGRPANTVSGAGQAGGVCKDDVGLLLGGRSSRYCGEGFENVLELSLSSIAAFNCSRWIMVRQRTINFRRVRNANNKAERVKKGVIRKRNGVLHLSSR